MYQQLKGPPELAKQPGHYKASKKPAKRITQVTAASASSGQALNEPGVTRTVGKRRDGAMVPRKRR